MIANDVLIETLVSVAETRSTAQSAKNLGIDIKTVSARLTALSKSAGGKVYNRGWQGKRLTITPLGLSLIEGRGVFNYITTSEAAEILDVQNGTVVNMCWDGRLSECATKQNGMWCIDPVAFAEFAKTCDKKTIAQKSWKARPGCISIKMAQDILGYKTSISIMAMLKRGEIEGEKIGKFWYLNEASVMARKEQGKRKYPAKRKRLQKTGPMATKAKPKPKQEPELTPHQKVMQRMAKRREAMG